MLLPRIDKLSSDVGSRLRAVIFTVFRCVFICMSTPSSLHIMSNEAGTSVEKNVPVIVPCTTDPFLSSTVTVSLFNFIKNLEENELVHVYHST